MIRYSVWFIAYLSLLSLFALIYRLSPGHFYYSSSVVHERVRRNWEDSLGTAIATDFLAMRQRLPTALTISGRRVQIVQCIFMPPETGVSPVITTPRGFGSSLQCVLFGSLHLLWQGDTMNDGCAIAVYVNVEPITSDLGFYTVDSVGVYGKHPGSAYDSWPPKGAIANPVIGAALRDSVFRREEPSLAAIGAATRYMETVAGTKTWPQPTYSQAFYLSAVTITTLGYGDIVPVTDTGRRLIALEVIMGVFLLGLAATDLSRKRRPHVTESTHRKP